MMASEFDVLSYGTIGMDVIIRIPHWPQPEISTHATDIGEFLGGKATNTAAHLAAWGLAVAVSGTVIGDDDMGDKVLTAIAQHPGVSAKYLERKHGLRSMFCTILVDPLGERAIIGVHTDAVEATPPSFEMISSARLLVLDLYGGKERIVAARIARACGLPVVVGDLRRLDHEILRYTTIAIASSAELRREYPYLSSTECAAQLIESGAEGAIITSGAGPVTVMDAKGAATELNPPRVAVVDTTGAGDAFRAGVAYGRLAGHSLVDSAALGAAAGSLTVERSGAASKPATMDRVRQLAKSLH